MLPLLDKPAIQYVVEEAVHSGFDDILIITGRGKRAIEDHFDRNPELEVFLERHEKNGDLRSVQQIADMADLHYIRQKEPLGLGHAVYQARKHVGNEPFAVLLGDDVVFSDVSCIRQLWHVHEQTQGSVVAVERVPPERLSAYGVVQLNGALGRRLHRIVDLVEKPAPAQAPSDLGILGRYVLTPGIFDALKRTPPGRNGETQLTDALRILCRREDVYAYAFEGRRYDLGNKMDWLKTNVEVALMRADYAPEFRRFLHRLLDDPPPLLPDGDGLHTSPPLDSPA
jgi:UTP--glucose-1-phosphate uridylyltransferase